MRPKPPSRLSELAARWHGRFHHRAMVLAYLVGLGLLIAATLTIAGLAD